MECRKLVITLVSAEDLPDVRSIGVMKVYAKVSIKGSESKTTQKSPVDMQGETNPRWNFHVEYTVSESSVEKPGVELAIKLFCKRTFGDKLIGEVSIPVKTLFDMGLKSKRIMSYYVAGTQSGRLNILYSFGEKIWVAKPEGWRRALGTAFLVLVGGALVLMSGQSDNDNDDDNDNDQIDEEDVCVDHRRDHDEEVFYDAVGG